MSEYTDLLSRIQRLESQLQNNTLDIEGRKALTNTMDFNWNEASKLVLYHAAAFPSVPAGTDPFLFYNESEGNLFIYVGGAWSLIEGILAVIAQSFFELDGDSDLEPITVDSADGAFELDGDSDIIPKETYAADTYVEEDADSDLEPKDAA